MNVLRAQKLKEVKDLIAKKVSLSELKKLKFKGSTPAMNKWIKSILEEDSDEELLTKKELVYLEYLSEESLKTEDKKATEQPVTKESKASVKQEQQFSKEAKERLEKLASEQLFNFIIEMYNEKKEEEKPDETEEKPLHINNIDTKYMNILNPVNKNCRVSANIYDQFTEICKKHNFTLTSVLNFLLDQFCQQNK